MIFGRHINNYYKKYALSFIIAIISLIAVDWVQLFIPKIYGKIIDLVDNNAITMAILKEEVGKIFICLIVMFIGRFLWRYLLFGNAIKIQADLRLKMFKKCESLSQSFYAEHRVGELMALYTNDLDAVKESFAYGILTFFDAIFLIILTFSEMLKIDIWLSIFSIFPLLLICVLGAVIGKMMEIKFKNRQEAYSKMSEFVNENLSGIFVIKAFVKETLELREFARINKLNSDKNIEFARLSVIFNIILLALITSVIIVILGYGGYLVYLDKSGLKVGFTIGMLQVFISYFTTLTWPMQAVNQFISLTSQAKASLKRINKLLNASIEIKDEDVVFNDEIAGFIEFKNLSFKYPDGNINVLNNISFKINCGETVGIIGRTGCGKTTLVDLLLRIYNVEENTIFLDGTDIMKIPFKKVRDTIGYVPQDNFLYSDTIRNNIAFAFDDIDDEDVVNAAKFSCLHNNIIDFEKQYDTFLGERGASLSGGQKQRVSIARALIKNPAILILDDSVSAVDTKTEESILQNLRQTRKSKTTILIAHRISTVRNLDKIILMDHGSIVDVGSHEELLQRCQMYQQMVKKQTLKEDVEGDDNA